MEFRSLKDGACVKYGKKILWHDKRIWDDYKWWFSIRRVAYVEGLHHNLISVSQLVVGTRLKVSFDDEGSDIIEKKSKKVLLKSMHKGEMYPLNVNPIRGKPGVCLLIGYGTEESHTWTSKILIN